MVQQPVWVGSHGVNRALRFDTVWPSLDIFKGNDTDIYFAAKTSGPNVILDEYGFEQINFDLTSAKIMFLVADTENNDAIVVTKTNGPNTGGISVTDALNGKMTISLSRTDFANLSPGIYGCEVVVQDVDGKVHTLAKSVLNLIHSVSEGISW